MISELASLAGLPISLKPALDDSGRGLSNEIRSRMSLLKNPLEIFYCSASCDSWVLMNSASVWTVYSWYSLAHKVIVENLELHAKNVKQFSPSSNTPCHHFETSVKQLSIRLAGYEEWDPLNVSPDEEYLRYGIV